MNNEVLDEVKGKVILYLILAIIIGTWSNLPMLGS